MLTGTINKRTTFRVPKTYHGAVLLLLLLLYLLLLRLLLPVEADGGTDRRVHVELLLRALRADAVRLGGGERAQQRLEDVSTLRNLVMSLFEARHTAHNHQAGVLQRRVVLAGHQRVQQVVQALPLHKLGESLQHLLARHGAQARYGLVGSLGNATANEDTTRGNSFIFLSAIYL